MPMDENQLLGARLGKYRLTARLGQGGMGVVYAAEDLRLRRVVAIKVVAGGLVSDSEWLARFQLEARAAARLNHPNVVTVHDVGHRRGFHFLVMELLVGGSVQARLNNQGPLPWPEATRIIADVCRGLSAAHLAGLIHRDIKPANILVAADGTAKLADFGLTKAPGLSSSRLTQLGTVLGTPQYMSPEHCTGEALDARADLYSLGATYYTLLVGRPPFDGPDPVQILYSQCSSPVPDPCKSLPTLPPESGVIVSRAMAKSRTERWRSADAMLEALQPLLVHAPSARSRIAPFDPATLTTRADLTRRIAAVHVRTRVRGRLVIAGLSLLMVALVLVGAIAKWGRSSPLDPGLPSAPSVRGEQRSTRSTRPAAMAEPLTQSSTPYRLQARGQPLKAHKGPVTSVCLANDQLATAGEDGNVTLWNPGQNVPRFTLAGNAPMSAVALAPDGSIVAAGGKAKWVRLWNAVTGDSIGTLSNLGGNVRSLAFSPSGQFLAVAGENDLQLFEQSSPLNFRRKAVLLQQQYVVGSVSFSADGRRLAACTDQMTYYVWDLPNPKPTIGRGQVPDIMIAAISYDGRRVVLGGHRGTLDLWEPDRDSTPRSLLQGEKNVSSAVFLPDGRHVIFAGEWAGPLKVLDLDSQRATRVPAPFAGAIRSLSLSRSGKLLAAGCSDGVVRQWDVESVTEP